MSDWDQHQSPTFTLKDNDLNFNTTLRVLVGTNDGFLYLYPDGYGEPGSEDGVGSPVFLELYRGRLQVVVSEDILAGGPSHLIDLEKARERRRPPEEFEEFEEAEQSPPVGE